MSRGKNLTAQQKKKIKAMFSSGVSVPEIAQVMTLAESTIFRHTKDVVVGRDKAYCVNATKDDYDFISDIAEEKGMTKSAALSEVVRLAKRRCLFSWGTK